MTGAPREGCSIDRGDEAVFRRNRQGREPSAMSSLKLIGRPRRPEAATVRETRFAFATAAVEGYGNLRIRLALEISRDRLRGVRQADSMNHEWIGAFVPVVIGSWLAKTLAT